MVDKLERITSRYGSPHDYSMLTELQRDFLLDPKIAEHTGASGWQTVSVTGVKREGDAVRLSVKDAPSMQSRRDLSKWVYWGRRKDAYTSLLGDQSPTDLTPDTRHRLKYEFNSPDGSVTDVDIAPYYDDMA